MALARVHPVDQAALVKALLASMALARAHQVALVKVPLRDMAQVHRAPLVEDLPADTVKGRPTALVRAHQAVVKALPVAPAKVHPKHTASRSRKVTASQDLNHTINQSPRSRAVMIPAQV